jgi:hypothetical protein
MGGGASYRLLLAAAAAIILLIAAAALSAALPAAAEKERRGDRFWTRLGGGIPPAEQARRFDAAEKGVPDMAWADAYWPPGYCLARPPPVPGEPARPPWP